MISRKLSSPSVIKELIGRHGFRFSKKLGQNFLMNEAIVAGIVDGAEITKDDVVIEIGPGIGVMTQHIAEQAKKVVAIEIDTSLMPILDETLKDYDNVKVINEDVLKLDLKKLIEEEFDGQKPKVVANLPYYVTTPIIMMFLEENIPVTDIVVMIQKEVAMRINAEPCNKTYGALSVSVQYFAEPSIVLNVPRTVFIPQPNVDSTVIRLKLRDEPIVDVIDRKLFFKTVRAAFSKRRKTLLNALSSSNLGISKDLCNKILLGCEIDPIRRGETLTIQEFAKLSNAIYKGVRA